MDHYTQRTHNECSLFRPRIYRIVVPPVISSITSLLLHHHLLQNESRQRGGDHLLSRESAFPAEDDNTCRRRALEDRHVVRSTAICGGGQMANGRRIQAAKCPCVHHTHMPGTAPDHISQAGQPASPSSQQPTQPSPPAPTVRIKSTRKGVVNREKAFSPFRCMDKSSVILC